jgi:hypothetical protein
MKKVALITATVIFITNVTGENKCGSLWSVDMVKAIIRGVAERFSSNCVYLLRSSGDRGEDETLTLPANINSLHEQACVGNLRKHKKSRL